MSNLKNYYFRSVICLLQVLSVLWLNIPVCNAEENAQATEEKEPVVGRETIVKSADELIADLQSQDADVVLKAIDVIGEKSEERAIPGLEKLADNPSIKIRKNAAIALGEIGVKDAVPTLLKLAMDKDTDVQFNAIYGLGKIQDARAVPVLLNLANSSNGRIAHAAIRSLGDIGSSESIPSLINIAKTISKDGKKTRDKEEATQRRAKKAGTAKAVSWIKCRQEAVLSLGRIGIQDKDVIQLLKDLLKDEASNVRRNASYALCLLAPKDSVSELIEAIKKKDSSIQINLKYALKIVNTEEVVSKLKELYKSSKDNTIRLVAIEIISSMRNNSCQPILMEAVDDKNKSIRYSAVKGLGELCSVEAVPKLCSILKGDKDSGIRAMAAEALGNIGSKESLGHLPRTPEYPAFQRGDEGVHTIAPSKESPVFQRGVQGLLEALDDENKKVKESALESIIKIGDKSVIPILKKKIEEVIASAESLAQKKQADRKEQYRGSVKKGKRGYAGSMGKTLTIADLSKCIAIIGGKEEGAYLKNFMNHKENTIRKAVISESYYVGDENIISELIEIAKNKKEDTELRLAAISSLGKIGSKDAVDCLIFLLNDEKEKIVIGSLNELGSIKDEKSAKYIVPLLKHKEEDISLYAARALSDIRAKETFQDVYETAWQKKGNNKLRMLTYSAKLINENNRENRDKISNEFIIALNEEFSAASVVADIAIYAAIIAAAVLLGGGGGATNTGPQYQYNWYPSYGYGYQIAYQYPPPSNTMVNDIIPPNKSIGIVSAIDEKDRAEKAVLAANGLYELKDIQGRVLLERALRSPYDEARMEVAKALGRLGDSRSTIPLVYYVQDISLSNRGHVAEALGDIGDIKALPYIRLVAFDDYKENRGFAVNGLEKIKSQESAQLLKELLNSEKDAKLWMEESGALYALTNAAPTETKNRIIGFLNCHIPEIRETAVRMCKKMNITEANDLIRKIADEDPILSIRKSAQESLTSNHSAQEFLTPSHSAPESIAPSHSSDG